MGVKFNKKSWDNVKEQIYFEDGSLRDILIFDWSVECWRKWVDLVNRKYRLGFYNGQTKNTSDKVDFQTVKDYWKGKSDLVNSATIYLNQVKIKCYFFDDAEFENDINPKEFITIADHINLMNYLVEISFLYGKTVLLTGENSMDSILIEVNKDKVKYCV